MNSSNKPSRYTGAEQTAAVQLSLWGLDLAALDDFIDLARRYGHHGFLLAHRTRLVTLLGTNREAARYAALWLSAELKLSEALPLADLERRRQAEHAPGEYKTLYEPKMSRSQRRGRVDEIVRLKSEGLTVAQIAVAVKLSKRTVQRALNPPK